MRASRAAFRYLRCPGLATVYDFGSPCAALGAFRPVAIRCKRYPRTFPRWSAVSVTELASKQQLRMSLVRWALVTVPAVLLLGFLSGAVSEGGDSAWYRALAKPALTPPDWLFPVAWTLLYILIGFALAMILNARGARERPLAIGLFIMQLIVNLVWNPLFFGAHRVLLAFDVIVLLILLAIATTLVFGRIRAAAAWLMVPYLAWICFAAALTWDIHRLNPYADTLVPSSGSAQIML
jgi:tryptophan-rich sensory protein